jgi:hypothetical protein
LGKHRRFSFFFNVFAMIDRRRDRPATALTLLVATPGSPRPRVNPPGTTPNSLLRHVSLISRLSDGQRKALEEKEGETSANARGCMEMKAREASRPVRQRDAFVTLS